MRKIAIFILALAAAGWRQSGSVYIVSLQGDDRNPGTEERPWRTLAHAVARLKPGDTLLVRGGTYFEQVSVNVSGTPEAPITIQSYPGERAVIDSGVPEFRTAPNEDWELVDSSTGEYRSKRLAGRGYIFAYIDGIQGYENERVALVPYQNAAAFRSKSDEYTGPSTPFYVGPGTFRDPATGRIHIRLAKTKEMREAEARYGRVLDGDKEDPRRYSIILSQARTTLQVTGSHLTFRGLTVNQAQESVSVSPGARSVRFEDVTVWLGYHGVVLRGAREVTITGSRVYGDHPHWISWTDMKVPPAPADFMRNTSIDLRSGSRDVEISWSHVRGSGQDMIGVNNDETHLSVHHNRLENCGDDAFELEGTVNVGLISIWENYVGNCFLFVAPGQDTVRYDGPLYVYRNVVALLRNPFINRKEGIVRWNGGGRYGFEYMFKHGVSSIYSTRNVHYYHNTLVMLNTAGQGLNLTPKDPAGSTFANNIAVMVNGVVNRDYRTGPGQIVDGNLYWKMNTVDTAPLLSRFDTVAEFSAATGLEKHGIGSEPKRGTNPLFKNFRPRFVNREQTVWELAPDSEIFSPWDFLLSDASPAVGAGVELPASLPDSRRSRDIGALPVGTPAAEFRKFPFTPPSFTTSRPPAAGAGGVMRAR